jgi:hypothetical protein
VHRLSRTILERLFPPIPTILDVIEFMKAAHAANLDPDFIHNQVSMAMKVILK